MQYVNYVIELLDLPVLKLHGKLIHKFSSSVWAPERAGESHLLYGVVQQRQSVRELVKIFQIQSSNLHY